MDTDCKIKVSDCELVGRLKTQAIGLDQITHSLIIAPAPTGFDVKILSIRFLALNAIWPRLQNLMSVRTKLLRGSEFIN